MTLRFDWTPTRRLALCITAAAALAAPATGARAGDEPDPKTGVREQSLSRALGDKAPDADLRRALMEKGVAYQFIYNVDGLTNTRGGMKRGATFSGRLEFNLDADLEKLMSWQGATFHTHMFDIQGAGLSRKFVGNLMPVSNIEAVPTFRLFELWVEQKFGDNFSIKIGQIGVDGEHATSSYAGLFNNGTFGWPAILGANLPSGGPAFTLATPAIRARYEFTKNTSWLVAVFNGDPAKPGPGDPQVRNPHGVDFRWRHGAYVVTEAQHKYNQEKDAAGLPGSVKLGVWRHLARFDDQRWGTDGLSLANPASNGIARRHNGNYGVYGMLDQMVWRLEGDKGVGIFARAFANPSDRNPVAWQFDGGVVANGVIAARPDDVFGVGFSYARISNRARAFDADVVSFGAATARRDFEAIVEANYQWQVMPGWSLQPNIQYIFHPGAHVANPLDPAGKPIRNALVFGLRSGWKW